MGWFDKGKNDRQQNPNAPPKTDQQLQDAAAREKYNAGVRAEALRQQAQQNQKKG